MRRKGLRFSQRWPVASEHGVGPSVLCCRLCSRMLSRRASHTSEGLATPVVEQMAAWPWERFLKGLGGPQRAGALKRNPHRWLHSCHGQIKAHDEFCHLKKDLWYGKVTLDGEIPLCISQNGQPRALTPPNTSKDVESEQRSLSLVGCTVGSLEAVSHRAQHYPIL